MWQPHSGTSALMGIMPVPESPETDSERQHVIAADLGAPALLLIRAQIQT